MSFDIFINDYFVLYVFILFFQSTTNDNKKYKWINFITLKKYSQKNKYHRKTTILCDYTILDHLEFKNIKWQNMFYLCPCVRDVKILCKFSIDKSDYSG